MRASEVTAPSFTGTLRSSRISTLLPERSQSSIRCIVRGICLFSLLRPSHRVKHPAARGDALQSAPVAGNVEHAIGIPPFVVEPGQDLYQAPPTDARLAGVDNAGAGVMIKVTGCQK